MRLPIISLFSEQFIPFVSILLLIFAFPYIARTIRMTDIFALLAFALAYCISILVHPENAEYLISISGNVWFAVLPIYFLGLPLDSEEHVDFLYKVSVLNMIAHGAYILAFGQAMSHEQSLYTGSMGRAYALLPHVILIGWYTLEHMNIMRLALFLVLSVYLISCGTRGAVLCLALFLLVYIVIYRRPTKHKGFFAVVVALMLFLIVKFDMIIKWLIITAEKMGMSARVLRFLKMGFFSSSGRDKISHQMFDAIRNNPILGYGVAGDRIIVQSYSHNIMIELLVSFGIVGGTALILLGAGFIFRGYRKAVSQKMGIFILVLFFSSVMKLLISDSYLFEPLFFMLLGVCVGQIRKSRKELSYEAV